MVDYDVVVVGSGFGGSVAALRLTEKGYRVGVLEAGRRFADDGWPARHGTCATSSGRRRWVARASSASTLLRDLVVLAGAGVGGGSLGYANTLYRPPDAFFDDPQWAHLADWRAELDPHYDEAQRMLGVTTYAGHTAADEVMVQVARDMGVSESYHPHARRGVLRTAGRGSRRPLLRRRRPGEDRLHRMRLLYDRMPGRREEHAGEELPLLRRAGRGGGAPDDHGDRGAPAAGRDLAGRHRGYRQAAYRASGA